MNGEPAGRHESNENTPDVHTKHDKEEPGALVTVKQHPFVMVVVVLIGDLLLSVGVTFP